MRNRVLLQSFHCDQCNITNISSSIDVSISGETTFYAKNLRLWRIWDNALDIAATEQPDGTVLVYKITPKFFGSEFWMLHQARHHFAQWNSYATFHERRNLWLTARQKKRTFLLNITEDVSGRLLNYPLNKHVFVLLLNRWNWCLDIQFSHWVPSSISGGCCLFGGGGSLACVAESPSISTKCERKKKGWSFRRFCLCSVSF